MSDTDPISFDDLLRAIAATSAEGAEFDCDQFLDFVAAYLERAGPLEDLPPELERVAQHLEACPECREEYEALIRGTDESGQES